MGLNPLRFIKENLTIKPSYWNQIIYSLLGDLVGRDSSGEIAKGQRLGTPDTPWNELWVEKIILKNNLLDPHQKEKTKQVVYSGYTSTNSNRSDFMQITENGIMIKGTPPLFYSINGIDDKTLDKDLLIDMKYTITAEERTSRECTIFNIYYQGGQWTEYEGEDGTTLELIDVGDKIKESVNQLVSLAIEENTTGEWGEILTGWLKVKNEHYYLEEVKRGIFNCKRKKLFQKHKAVMLNLCSIFLSDKQQAITSLSTPLWSISKPSSSPPPLYWFDLVNGNWNMANNDGLYTPIEIIFIGFAVFDFNKCLYCRSVDFSAAFSDKNDCDLLIENNKIISTKHNIAVSVYGQMLKFINQRIEFIKEKTLAPTSLYFLYISDKMQTIITHEKPYREDFMNGFYHPKEAWRCLGEVYTNDLGEFDLINCSRYNNHLSDEFAYIYHEISSTDYNETLRKSFLLETYAAKFNANKKLSEPITLTRPLNILNSDKRFLKLDNNSILLLCGTYEISIQIAEGEGIEKSSLCLTADLVDLESSKLPLYGISSKGVTATLEGSFKLKAPARLKVEQTITEAIEGASIAFKASGKIFRFLTIKITRLKD
ncbi:MAG: hypothetical protein HQK51_19130 [Oligoflexia bacterium]|nr:hypothetical protein [Oligoflexia bacterium]